MKLLLEGLVVALVLIAELVGLVVLATRYTTTTTEARPLESGGSLAIVASDDGAAYRRVEWDGSSCGVWGVRWESESSVEVNSFSESDAQECTIRIRPHLTTARHPGGRPTGGHRPEPTTSENASSRHLGE